MRAGECDYEAGAWLEALDFLSVAQRAEAAFAVAPMTNEDDDLQRILLYGGYILGVSKGQPAEVQESVVAKIADWPDRDVLEETAEEARKVFVEIAATPGAETSQMLAMPPFCDCAPTRRFEWSALGVDWCVEWPNGVEMTLVAEQFMAVLQLLLADLATSDLYILPSRIELQLEFDDDADTFRVTRQPSNRASICTLSVPRRADEMSRDQRHLQEVACSVTLIQEVSLRPAEWPVLEGLAVDGPLANTLVGEQYTTLCRSFCDLQPVILDSGHQDPDLEEIYLKREPHPELGWNDSLVEEYDEEEVTVWLKSRYDRFGASSRLALPRILSSPEARAILVDLRAQGWLDWQLLGAISGIAMNYRVARQMGTRPSSPSEFRALADRYMREEESDAWSEVPLELFSKDEMLFQMTVNIASTVRLAGLVCRQQTPNERALVQFVRFKMRYFDDDMPHDDILAETD